eukprot:gene11682-4917_t
MKINTVLTDMKYSNMYNFGQFFNTVSHESELNDDSPVWILGCEYINPKDDLENIKTDIQSKLWCSYRKDFSPISSNVKLTTDAGWGCMIRTGQMLLCQAYINLLLGRKWRIKENECTPKELEKIIDLVYDKQDAPYSIHKIAQFGTSFSTPIGEWFGPSTITNVISKLSAIDTNSAFSFYISDQSCLYLDEIEEINKNQKIWKPLIILMPIRLGLDKLNPIYIRFVCKTFEISQSIGIVGGKPSSSFYFIGCQDDCLFYLDPHVVQNVSNSPETYQCNKIKKIKVADIDPSMSLGFMVKDKNDYQKFISTMKKLGKMKNAFIQILDEKPKLNTKSFEDFLEEEEDDYQIV